MRCWRPGRCLLVALLALALPASAQDQAAKRWWKGNLHTHTLWSDGDHFPEVVLQMYKEKGYHFVSLSDHNTLGQSTKTFNPWMMAEGRERVADYIRRFGEDWVDIQEINGETTVRLKTIDESRQLLEEEGRFLVLQAEEITDRFEDKPIHLNATNLVEFVAPQGGESALDTMQRNLDAVLEQRRRTGVPMIVHLNHPNFGYGITLKDFIELKGERFFEVYNGHPLVHNEGDEDNPSTESMWDIINTLRVAAGRELLVGLAVDDGHDYAEMRPGLANPFRGWVMVRAESLTADDLIAALEAGDFYSSSGVTLEDVQVDGEGIHIEIEPREGVRYRTQFIGTRRAPQEKRSQPQYGAVLAEVSGERASYDFTGDEVFVRAVVLSDRLKDNPYRVGEFEKAWTQPVRPGNTEEN